MFFIQNKPLRFNFLENIKPLRFENLFGWFCGLYVVLFNVVDLVATVVSAVQVRKGKQIEWYVYGGLTDLICKP